jgi:hypothetical protein
MTDAPEPTGPSQAEAQSRPEGRDRRDSFQLIAYTSIFVFMLLYVFSVEGAERLLDAHFRKQIDLAVEDPDPHRPISPQIQSEIETRILDSRWVRIGGVKVTVIVLGSDGTYLYVGGRVSEPPLSVGDLAANLREAQRLLPVSGDAIVSVPHNTVLSNALLLLYASLLLQGLFVYNRYANSRNTKQLEQALAVRDQAAERAAQIEAELDAVRHHLSTVEPAERQHTEEIRVLQHEREILQRKLSGLAAREEELRGKAERAVELDQERQALEELLEEASADISSKDEELSTLQSNLKRASKTTKTRGRESDQLGKRLRALYPTIEVDEKALQDFIALHDEVMKLKAEQAIKRLDSEADNVAVRRKVGGLPNHLSIFELGFAGKGRIYYMRGRQRRFRLLAVGAKNSQNQDMDYLSRLPRED